MTSSLAPCDILLLSCMEPLHCQWKQALVLQLATALMAAASFSTLLESAIRVCPTAVFMAVISLEDSSPTPPYLADGCWAEGLTDGLPDATPLLRVRCRQDAVVLGSSLQQPCGCHLNRQASAAAAAGRQESVPGVHCAAGVHLRLPGCALAASQVAATVGTHRYGETPPAHLPCNLEHNCRVSRVFDSSAAHPLADCSQQGLVVAKGATCQTITHY